MDRGKRNVSKGKKRRNQQHKREYNRPSSSSTDHDTTSSDIPGYYYDAEKKNYFKILPNSMTSVSSFVTKESIDRKKNEDKRISDLNGVKTGSSAKILQEAIFSLGSRDDVNKRETMTSVLAKLQCGQVTCETFRSRVNRHRCSTLKPGAEIFNDRCSLPRLHFDHLQRMVTDADRKYLVCVWSVKSSVAQSVQLLKLDGYLHSHRQQPRDGPGCTQHSPVVKTINTLDPIFKRLNSLCWIPNFPGYNDAKIVLCAATCPVGYSPTIASIFNLEATQRDTINLFELNLGFSTVWSSAWHDSRVQFSVGSERKCQLIDVATRRSWTYNTQNSDPLAQMFSTTDANRLYNGTRKGFIVVHDVRCPGKDRPLQQMRQKVGVGCLRLLHNDNYIMASDFSGDIVNWDHRMGRIVMKYEGLKNSHYQLPFHLDESESVVCAAGSDSYTKLWDVRTGELLQNIPPPVSASPDSFPIAMYSQRWGGSGGNSGIIIGLRNMLKLYC